LYVRIARTLGVDPSYVSRVARGQRSSALVETALRRELELIRRKIGPASPAVSRPALRHDYPRLGLFVRRDSGWLRREWLRHCQADRLLRKFPLSGQKRSAPILPLIEKAVKRSQFTGAAPAPLAAARKHGRLRRKQGYSVTALVREYSLARRCIAQVAENYLDQMNSELLLHDLDQANAAIDRQLLGALSSFLDHA
jgi:hypothetical protein